MNEAPSIIAPMFVYTHAEETMPPMNPVPLVPYMTPRQRAIVDFIRDFSGDHGYPPSVREIGHWVGLSSTSSVHHQLRRLEDLGVLVRVENRSRAVTLAGVDGEAA